MDQQEFMKKFTGGEVATEINRLSTSAAVMAGMMGNSTIAAGVVVQCTVAAVKPLFGMFEGGALQERLLFALLLAGACSTIKQHSEGDLLAVDVSPSNVLSALALYKKLTDQDITSHLCASLQSFAKSEPLALN